MSKLTKAFLVVLSGGFLISYCTRRDADRRDAARQPPQERRATPHPLAEEIARLAPGAKDGDELLLSGAKEARVKRGLGWSVNFDPSPGFQIGWLGNAQGLCVKHGDLMTNNRGYRYIYFRIKEGPLTGGLIQAIRIGDAPISRVIVRSSEAQPDC